MDLGLGQIFGQIWSKMAKNGKRGKMHEFWVPIENFPLYSVSNLGHVKHNRSGNLISRTKTAQGAWKVSLYHEGAKYTRSVKVLVARAFVKGYSETNDTPIQLDGNQDNVTAENLLWRPRWFAWQYTRQWIKLQDRYYIGPIYNIETGDIYKDAVEAAMLHGLLVLDVYISAMTSYTLRHSAVYPYYQRYAFCNTYD